MCIPCALLGPRNASISLQGETLPVVTEYKYLGTVISDDKSDKLDIERQIRATYAQGNSIVRKFNMCSYMVKLRLFKSFCGTFYNCHLWYRYNRATLVKLRTAYRAICRQLFGLGRRDSMSTFMVQNNLPTFNFIIRRQIYSFMSSLNSCTNAILQSFGCDTDNELLKFYHDTLYV